MYFPSADGNVYCLNKNDGSVIWKFKGKDSMKATPAIVGDKIIASGLDHTSTVSTLRWILIWDFRADSNRRPTIVWCRVATSLRTTTSLLNPRMVHLSSRSRGLSRVRITIKTAGSISEPSVRLFCLDPADGKTIWKSKIGADSDSTPAVANGFVYTAAEDGVVRCYKQDTGELVWNFATDGAHLGRASEKIGIWASPIVSNGKVYIGAGNGYMYCLSAEKGEVVWKYKARGGIWGTAPVVDGRVVFGDKAGCCTFCRLKTESRFPNFRSGRTSIRRRRCWMAGSTLERLWESCIV